MRIKDKLTPYPILSLYNDDYVNSHFFAKISKRIEFEEVIIDIKFTLDNPQLKQLITNGKAKYSVHVECPITSLRLNISSNSEIVEIRLKADEVIDKLEICTFIVANCELGGYKNDNFHPDYRQFSFDINKGNILAIGPAEDIWINKDLYKSVNLKNLIKIRKSQIPNAKFMSVNLDSDEILILLPEFEYQKYTEHGKQGYKSTVLSMVLFPTMVYVLNRMKTNTDDILPEKQWYKSMEKLLENNGIKVDKISIEDGNGKYSVFRIAQQIFMNPVERAFREIDNIEGRVNNV